MKKQIIKYLLIIMCCCSISGCGKNYDQMSDEAFYDYLSGLTEEELTKETSIMTEDQQRRASMVLLLMEAQEKQERDSFSTEQ